jgi:serine/threonine protein phosphatase 1
MPQARTIAIGDIHGCANTLLALLDKLDITTADTIIFLGDYIDRGPDSKSVILCLLALMQEGYHIITLRGNHEQMFLNSEQGFSAFSHFVNNGGDATLENFGCDFFNELPHHFQEFFLNTKYYHETDTHIFVHAGLNFDKENILEDTEAMMWVRGFEPNQEKLGHKKLLHGHTPLALQYILNQKGNCINIDAGCVYHGRAEGMGYLVAYVCELEEFVWVEMCE